MTATESVPEARAVDTAALERLVGQVIADAGGALTVPLALLGDRLGLFVALAAGPTTPAALAERTGLVERYVREWHADRRVAKTAGQIGHPELPVNDPAIKLGATNRAAAVATARTSRP